MHLKCPAQVRLCLRWHQGLCHVPHILCSWPVLPLLDTPVPDLGPLTWRGWCISPGAGVGVVGDILASLGSDQSRKHAELWLLCSKPPLLPALAVLRRRAPATHASASVTWSPPHAPEQPQALPHSLPCRSLVPSCTPPPVLSLVPKPFEVAAGAPVSSRRAVSLLLQAGRQAAWSRACPSEAGPSCSPLLQEDLAYRPRKSSFR